MKEDVNKSKKPRAKKSKEERSIVPVTGKSSEQDKLNRLLKLARSAPSQTAIAIIDQEPMDPEIREAIEHAMKHYLPEVMKNQKMLETDMKNLESLISEYLKNFIIIGYDLAGEKIQMMHATNAQEHDSLIECARGSLLTLMIKAQQQLPGFPPGS